MPVLSGLDTAKIIVIDLTDATALGVRVSAAFTVQMIYISGTVAAGDDGTIVLRKDANNGLVVWGLQAAPVADDLRVAESFQFPAHARISGHGLYFDALADAWQPGSKLYLYCTTGL